MTHRRRIVIWTGLLLAVSAWSLAASAAVAADKPGTSVQVVIAIIGVVASVVGLATMAVRQLGTVVASLTGEMRDMIRHLRELIDRLDSRQDAHDQLHAGEAVVRAEWTAETRHRLGSLEDSRDDHERRIGALERGPGEQTRRAG